MFPKDIIDISASLVPTIGLGRTEAENLGTDSGFVVQSNGAASGGAMLQATATNATAMGVFVGAAGSYDLTIGYFDETDGVSSLSVLVNGIVADSFDWDSEGGAAIANAASLTERVVTGLSLAPGDEISLTGMKDGGEPLRTDYITLAAAGTPPPPPSGTAFEIEAEDLTIVSGFKVVSNGAASGGATLQDDFLTSGGAPVEARATYTMAQTGVFDLTIDYFDETDGVSSLRVLVNGVEVDSFLWDDASGAATANGASLTARTVTGLDLTAGDVVELAGFGDGGEPLRIDKLSFQPAVAPPPPATSFVIEAEDLTILSGFKIVSNGAASGGATLQDDFVTDGGAPVEARATYTVTQAGVFDLSIGVFDENDGTSDLRVLVNGIELSSFTLDSLSGSSIANSASAAELNVGPVLLEAGDEIEIAGFGDGGEPLRVDFLRFETISLPPPPIQQVPDIWFEDFNEIIVATANGDGNFTEMQTGIMVDGADVLSGDFNGDNLIDFVRIAAIGAPIMTADPLVDEQEVEITVYTNDGNANFSAQPTQTVFSALPAGLIGSLAFSAQDAGDIDGDGDLDILAVGTTDSTNFAFFYENNGAGTFSPLATSNLPQGEFVQEALLADMNSDGNDDVIVFNGVPSSAVDVYANDGAGNLTFLDSIGPSVSSNGDGQVLDLDGDGDLDFVFSASGEGRGIYGYINDGTGARDVGNTPFIFGDENGIIGASVAADFDGDGEVEVVSMGSVDDAGVAEGLRVFDVVTSATGVEFVLNYAKPGIVGNAVAFGDFDTDGDLDILFTPPNSDVGDPNLRFLLNDGSGDFVDGGPVVPPFSTTDFSFAPVVGVDFFDDPLF